MFCSYHFIFRFWFLITFGDEVMKIIRNLCLHFAKQDRQDGKNGKKITQLKLPKYQKPEDKNMGWTKQSYQWISQFRTFNSTHDFYPIQWNSSRNPEIFLQELPIRIAAAARFEFNCLVSLGAFSKWQVDSGDCKGYLIFFYDLLSNEDNELIKLLYKNLFCFVCSKQKYFFIEKSFLLTPVICP